MVSRPEIIQKPYLHTVSIQHISSTRVKLLHSLKAINKGFNSPTGVKLLYSLNIFIDDDDDDGDDDDDDVERTRAGRSAVRSDLEHQVNHNAKISHFHCLFSSYEEGGPAGAGKTRCLAV